MGRAFQVLQAIRLGISRIFAGDSNTAFTNKRLNQQNKKAIYLLSPIRGFEFRLTINLLAPHFL